MWDAEVCSAGCMFTEEVRVLDSSLSKTLVGRSFSKRLGARLNLRDNQGSLNKRANCFVVESVVFCSIQVLTY